MEGETWQRLTTARAVSRETPQVSTSITQLTGAHAWETLGPAQRAPRGGQRGALTPPQRVYNSDFTGLGEVPYPSSLAFKDNLCPVYTVIWVPLVVVGERLVCLRWSLPKSILLCSPRIIA